MSTIQEKMRQINTNKEYQDILNMMQIKNIDITPENYRKYLGLTRKDLAELLNERSNSNKKLDYAYIKYVETVALVDPDNPTVTDILKEISELDFTALKKVKEQRMDDQYNIINKSNKDDIHKALVKLLGTEIEEIKITDTENEPTTFGKYLKNTRKAYGFSQTEVIKYLHSLGVKMSPTTLSAIENDNKLPSLKAIIKLSELLNLDVSYMYYNIKAIRTIIELGLYKTNVIQKIRKGDNEDAE